MYNASSIHNLKETQIKAAVRDPAGSLSKSISQLSKINIGGRISLVI